MATSTKKKVTKKPVKKTSAKKHIKKPGKPPKKTVSKKSENGQVEKRKAIVGTLGDIKTGSTRMRLFKSLNKFKNGLTAQGIKEKTGMAKNSGHLAVLLKEEVENKKIKIEVHDIKERDVRFYLITALGIKDLKSGNLDKTSMGGNRIGQKWTNKRRTADKKK